MTKKLVAALSLALVAGLSACEEDGFGPPRECTSPISLTVSSDTPPQFTWTAACAVARVVVFEPPTLDATSVMWDVRSAPPRILSPVQYGVRPLGSTEEHAAEALVAGETYRVQIFSDVQIMIGSASFTP